MVNSESCEFIDSETSQLTNVRETSVTSTAAGRPDCGLSVSLGQVPRLPGRSGTQGHS
jgi:hypothetical protein